MHIRPATRADSADIAILDDIASSGLASHVLETGVREGRYDRSLECGRDGIAYSDGPYSWVNALIAEIDGDVAGMSLSFELAGTEPDADADADVSGPVLEPIEKLKSRALGTRFIDSVGVYNRFRGRGAGKALVEAEIARAEPHACSIITDDANGRALELYRGLGFIEQAHAPYVPFSQNRSAGRWVLLIRPAASQAGASISAH
ncbi:GNAT family N-acetyltransferase [uncultured Hoeflea sp.]|uniref:GNAT family N-acetyltransferase n=1 Tax=uncultured Hoeflea sp. TaxID=538666 RepID=UPI00261D66E3|nr:GNAT family N-acetyltransferase [uncultured Hoeflea sp.]